MSPTLRKRKKDAHGEEQHGDQERWLLTYADMITLLMVLFILLFAISQVDQKKFDQLSQGMANQFGSPHAVLTGQTSILESSSMSISLNPTIANPALRSEVQAELPVTPPKATSAQLMSSARRHALLQAADFTRVKAQILAALHKSGLDGSVKFTTDGRGLTVSVITNRVLFAADLATLAPEGELLVKAIAPALEPLPNDIQVEGHTNNVAVKPKYFPTDWELSSARADTVVRYFIENDRISPKRFGAVGYADQRPLLPASDPRSVSVNRRVDIVILSTLTPAEQGALSAAGFGKS
ncbi:MAG TPA: flagellar motor protein MotB [Candidatus Nanopelagicaceae bacterium]|nr:flagellar motor protein MotB [Candidatus Nanopelagicaceae bacterium]